MTSLVDELQRDALKQSVPITELLQKSLVVATKLKQEEFLAWIHQELDGYDTTDVPTYRLLHGSPKVFNPYRGYQPLYFPDAKTAKRFCKMHFNTPIGEIEHSVSGSSGTIAISYMPEIEQKLVQAIEFGLQPSLHFSTSQLQQILTAVRKIVLEWALKLEENGITGDGMSFSSEERARAERVTYNVKNLIQGSFDRSQVQIEPENSPQLQEFSELNLSDVAAFKELLLKEKDNIGLGVDEAAELDSDIKTIEAQIQSPKPKDSILRGSLDSIRKILEGAAGNLLASGLLNHLGKLFGG